jgi:uncharacterized protein YlaN (UPF0358 family)
MKARALAIIKDQLGKLAESNLPDALRPRFAGEIDMAYKLGLISYEERDQLMTAMIVSCKDRRDELHKAKLARLGIKQ